MASSSSLFPLHLAAKEGDVEKVEDLLQQGRYDVDCTDQHFMTPLLYACLHGHLNVIRTLITGFKADLNARDVAGYSGLHFACKKGDLAMVKVLVSEFKADLSGCTVDGSTACMVAAAFGHADVVLALLNYRCFSVNDANSYGWTVLHFACSHGDIRLVRILLCDYNANINACNSNSRTPFHEAICSEKYDLVSILVSEFEPQLLQPRVYRRSLLHYACEWGNVQLVRTLIRDCKADIYAQDAYDMIPLDLATSRRHLEVVFAFTREFGYSPKTTDIHGRSLLHYACEWGHNDFVNELLFNFKLDPYSVDYKLQSPLHLAVYSGHLSLAKRLSKKYGKSLLHFACQLGDVELARFLKHSKLKLNIYSLDKGKCTPFDVAILSRKTDMIFFLIREFGYDPNRVDVHGRTLLHYACEWGNVGLIRYLLSEFRANMNLLDFETRTPFDLAIKKHNSSVVLLLVKEFGSSAFATDANGMPLLYSACMWTESFELVQYLMSMQHTDDKNSSFEVSSKIEKIRAFLKPPHFTYSAAKDRFGRTFLHWASEWGDLELIQLLVQKHKVKVNARDKKKLTAFDIAVANRNLKVIRLFLTELGYDPNKKDTDGYAVLHHACKWGDIKLISLLMEVGADVSICDDNGDTPLHAAAYFGQAKAASELINKLGCNPNIVGSSGYTPLHVATGQGHRNIVSFLLKFASPLVQDQFGNTPLHLASKFDHCEIVKLLVKSNPPSILTGNSQGNTPVDVSVGDSEDYLTKYKKDNLKLIQASYKKYFSYSKKAYSGSHCITRVFVLGNPGAGKSSLIESLKREGLIRSHLKVSESSVPPHTAGIIPSNHMSKHYGRILFYDFAGDAEYYSSHAAILESIAFSRKGDNIFILVVDLRNEGDIVETTLFYWFSFIQFQKFNNPSLIVIGSHSDTLTAPVLKTKIGVLNQFCEAVNRNIVNVKYFMLDCRNPRSSQIDKFKRQILTWVRESPKYELSEEASLLLGLLEKNFKKTVACSVDRIKSHFEDSGVWQPTNAKALYQIILELHEVGTLLVLGNYSKEYHTVLKISKLTHEIHQLLFSKSAPTELASFNIGILPESVLEKVLPPYITKECLIHFQYCQQIRHCDVGFFPSLKKTEEDQSLLFFPALCSVDKGQVSWAQDSSSKGFSIGWLALCIDLHDYFPSRFLHVLLLRLVYRFTLSVPEQLQAVHASPEHSRRCTMWKKGVHWKMEKGVDCLVELVNGSKAVVVHCASSDDRVEVCNSIFVDVVSCVMQAKAEFCHSIKPQVFLLDSSTEANYFNRDHQFALCDVERALKFPESVEVILSVSGRGEMELSKLQGLKKLTHWGNLFPFHVHEVLRVLKAVVDRFSSLGLTLGAPVEFLQKLDVNFSNDLDRRKRELVLWWMNFSRDPPPCWWTLTEALEDVEYSVLAQEIANEHGVHIQLQEKMLNKRIQALKPDDEFLDLLAGVVGSNWPSLAVSLALTDREIEMLNGMVEFSQQELALQMLKIWKSRKEATYGQLRQTLNTIILFQYSS